MPRRCAMKSDPTPPPLAPVKRGLVSIRYLDVGSLATTYSPFGLVGTMMETPTKSIVVCPSGPVVAPTTPPPEMHVKAVLPPTLVAPVTPDTKSALERFPEPPDRLPAPCAPFLSGDRKSVVQGKSVSVRVDLGGRRIIKKKK